MNQFWPFQANEKNLRIWTHGLDLRFSPCWPILANVGHVVILCHLCVSDRFSSWSWPYIGLSTGHTLTDHLRSSGLASEEETGSDWGSDYSSVPRLILRPVYSLSFIRYQPVPVVCWACLCAHFVPDSSQNRRRRRSITGKGLNEAGASLWAQAHDLQHYYGSAEALAAARVPRWLVAVLRLHEGSWRGQLLLNSHSWNPMIIFIKFLSAVCTIHCMQSFCD